MSVFNGAALYTKAEIGRALDNRKLLNSKYSKIEKLAIKATQSVDVSYKKFGFLWTVSKSDYDNLLSSCDFMFGSYLWRHKWLEDEGYITKWQSEGINNHCLWYTGELRDIKNLYNGGKSCYLNPKQAEFVNYYKNIKIEEE